MNLGFELYNTDMLDYVRHNKRLSEDQARVLVRQMVAAVDHLHNECDVVHLDLKLENMFLDANGTLKVGDFGLSAIKCESDRVDRMSGSTFYAAPEVLALKECGPYDGRAADVWSLGMCAFVLCRGGFPLRNLACVRNLYLECLAWFTRDATMRAGATRPPRVVLLSDGERATLSDALLCMLDKCLALLPRWRPTSVLLSQAEWLQENDDASGDVARGGRKRARGS